MAPRRPVDGPPDQRRAPGAERPGHPAGLEPLADDSPPGRLGLLRSGALGPGRLAGGSAVPVEPGLRLKRPWPFEDVDRYPVRRVQTLGLGYAGPSKASLLWGRRHAGEEYQLLLGDGRELVSVDATVSYRIRDVVAFALAFENPRETLEALAYRLL